MNWFESEQQMHEHVLRAERAAEQYPHIAHLVEQAPNPTPASHLLVAFGGLLVTWGNQLQARWTVELPDCTSTPMATNSNWQ
jgi:hypothetical protein